MVPEHIAIFPIVVSHVRGLSIQILSIYFMTTCTRDETQQQPLEIHRPQKVFLCLSLYGVKLPLIQAVWEGHQRRTLKLVKRGHLFLCPWHQILMPIFISLRVHPSTACVLGSLTTYTETGAERLFGVNLLSKVDTNMLVPWSNAHLNQKIYVLYSQYGVGIGDVGWSPNDKLFHI